MTEERLSQLLSERRWCYYIPPVDGFIKGKGFRVSIVIEDEPGHFPTGDLKPAGVDHKEPWFWGMTYDEAEQHCAEQNAKLGLDVKAVWEIVNSSMFSKPRRRRRKGSTS